MAQVTVFFFAIKDYCRIKPLRNFPANVRSIRTYGKDEVKQRNTALSYFVWEQIAISVPRFNRGVVQMVACQSKPLELEGSNPVPAIYECYSFITNFNDLGEPTR